MNHIIRERDKLELLDEEKRQELIRNGVTKELFEVCFNKVRSEKSTGGRTKLVLDLSYFGLTSTIDLINVNAWWEGRDSTIEEIKAQTVYELLCMVEDENILFIKRQLLQ